MQMKLERWFCSYEHTCSCRRVRFNFQHPHGQLTTICNFSFRRFDTLWPRKYQAHIRHTRVHTSRQTLIYIKINKSKHGFKKLSWSQVSLSRRHPMLPQLGTHHFFPASSPSCRPSLEAERDQGTPSSFLSRHPLLVVALSLGSPNSGLYTVVPFMAVSPVPGVRLGLGRSWISTESKYCTSQ